MTAALILAAGSTSGETAVKPTDDIGGISSIRRVITAFRRAGAGRIVVVTGYDAETLERHCAHMGVIFLRRDEYEAGDMLSSVKTGLSYLNGKCSRVFISPADTPLFSVETVRRMEAIGSPVVVPAFEGKPGHPLLVSAELFNQILAFDGQGGLEGALACACVARRIVEVSDCGILADLSRDGCPESCDRRPDIRAETRVRLVGDRAFFGPGTLQLLRLTDETRSLKHAARQMGVSYSKAIKMILEIERQLGFPVLVSKQGGRQGGGSQITEEGARFVRSYDEFESECIDLVDAAFERHFGDVRSNIT